MKHYPLAILALLLCSIPPVHLIAEPEESSTDLLATATARLDECRQLFSSGKEDEALELAQASVAMFTAPYPKLKRIDIGHIKTPRNLIVVYLNTTEDERRVPKPPISLPYSFFVYTNDEKPAFLYRLDFEHAFDDGMLVSAAIGQGVTNRHINYGLIATDTKFSDVKKRVLELIDQEKPEVHTRRL